MGKCQSTRLPVIFRLSIAVAVLISIASCSLAKQDKVPQMKKAIIGKWKEINGPASIQFFEGGTVILTGKEKTMTAYYKVMDEEHLRIEPKFSAQVSEDPGRLVKFSIVRGHLTIDDLLEKSTRFQKQK
jgi:hypothetical protein